MAVDYDVKDAAPTSFAAMVANWGSVFGPPWKPTSLQVATQKTELFTRSGAVTNTDLKTYDHFYLYVGTEGGDSLNSVEQIGRAHV